MRFFHLSDLHIGKHLHLYNLAQDQKYILKQIVEKAEECHPDAIVIAGDIYDKSVPSGEAYQLFDEFLNSLAEIKPSIPILIIAGNHDSQERLQYASSFLERHQIYIATKPPQEEDEHLKKITLTDSYGEVDFYLFPFTKPGYVRHLFPQEEVTDYEKAYELMLKREEIDPSRRSVLVAHQFFVNQGQKPEVCDSEQMNINVGGLDSIDIRVISDFDYVAAGHIHGPQSLGNGRVRYCGTPLKYSFSECQDNKSLTIVEVKEKGNVEIESIPLVPLHDMVKIKGNFMEIMNPMNFPAIDNNSYLHITLTDELDVPEAFRRLNDVYPNLMQMEYDNTRTRQKRELHISTENAKRNPLEMFANLYALGVYSSQGFFVRETI